MIPTGWIEKRLGEISAIGAGNSAPQGDENFTGGIYPFFRTADVGRAHFGIINNSADLLNEEGKTGLKLFKKGTILFPKSGASTFLNHRVMMGVDGFVVSHLATITPNESIISGKYLLYYLSTIDSKTLIQDQSYPSLNLPIISSINVKCPEDIKEQQRIVEKLDTLFADIEKEKQIAQKNLQNAKELFESGIQKLCLNSCGDNVVKVGDILSLEYGKALERQQRSETGKYLVYGANGPIGRTDQYLCEGKTIIVGRKGSVGEIVVALENNWPVDVTYCVKFDSNLYDFDFLYYLLRGLKLLSMAKGVKPGLNRNDVYALKVHVPQSINEQRNIAQKLNKLHEQSQELERIYTKQIADLDELKQAILKKAFNGEL